MGNAIGKPRVSPLLSLNMMKVRNQPKLRRVMGNVDRTFWPKLLSTKRRPILTYTNEYFKGKEFIFL
jgi:hypothetical protein